MVDGGWLLVDSELLCNAVLVQSHPLVRERHLAMSGSEWQTLSEILSFNCNIV